MKPMIPFHRGRRAIAANSAALALALAFAHIAGAQNNTKFGTNAEASITTGTDDTASGFSALQLTTTGKRNTAVGSLSLQNNSTGSYNTAVGFKALTLNTAGSNTALGDSALSSNSTGAHNTATGLNALQFNTLGSFNTAAGRDALKANTDGVGNVAFGYQALSTNTSGDFNVAIGDGALLNNTGSGNIGIGEDGGFNLTAGDNNISIGNKGVAGESNIIRIGTAQTDTFLTGIIHGDGSGLTGVPAASVTGTLTSAQIGTGAVTNTKIASGAVTSAKLASGLTLGGATTGSFSGPLAGNASTATSAVSFTGSLAGNVTGTQGATVVSTVGGVTAANVALGANLANAATSANVANAIVRRGASGGFVADNITLAGNLTLAGKVNQSFLTVTGAGNEQAYLGGDGVGSDVQFGSLNAAITDFKAYNATSGTFMDVYANGVKARGASVTSGISLQVEGTQKLSGGGIPTVSIGTYTGKHLEMDNNEIQAGTANPASSNPSTLSLNSSGGEVRLSESGSTTTVVGKLALEGQIQVPGAGLGTNRAVFIHRATAGNSSGDATIITHPMSDGDPNAILFVTQNLTPGGTATTFNSHPIGVGYNGSKWAIFNEDIATMTVGAAFNVMIVKP